MSSSPVSKSKAKYSSIQTATESTTDATSDSVAATTTSIDPRLHGHGATTTTATARPVVEDVHVSTFSMEMNYNNNNGSGGTITSNGDAYTKGQVQEPAYRDKWFGIAFICQLIVMVVVTGLYATGSLQTVPSSESLVLDEDFDTGDGGDRVLMVVQSYHKRFMQYSASSSSSSYDDHYDVEEEVNEQDEDDITTTDLYRFLIALMASLIIAPTLAIVAMKFMKSHGVPLIQFSLYFAIGFNILLGVILVVSAGPVGVFNLLFAVLLYCYAKAVWQRIPFAAANLKTAVTCVESNGGMTFLGLLKIPLLTIWTVMWAYVFSSVMASPWMQSQEYDVNVTDDYQFGHANTHESEGVSGVGIAAILGLLLSFYWTSHVLHNVVHTTLAGTVGTWWFLPQEANGCCSPGLTDSLARSLTYSFGSICFGSLLVAIIEVVKNVVRSAARNRRGGVFMCIAQCLLHWIERLAEYFNKWAFIYVGLYGYSYVEAGKNVISLFKNRGWTTIINDALVGRMLGMVCLCIGLVNALVAAILTLGADGVVVGTSALIGFFAGVMLSLMVANVLISATDSILVLFAEAPREFQENHPALAHEMQDTWSQAWPDLFTHGPEVVATPVV
jgi:Plasma-membrane choline transporter